MRSGLTLVISVILACTSCANPRADRPRNFAVVEVPSARSGGIYRGGRPSPAQILSLRKDLNIRTIIKLNRGGGVDERITAQAAGMKLIDIPLDPKMLGTADSSTMRGVDQALAALADSRNTPVYIHCDHGGPQEVVAVTAVPPEMSRPLNRKPIGHGK